MPILPLPRGDFQAGPRTNDSINSVNHPLRIPIPPPPPNFNRCVDYVRLKGCRITILPLKNKLNKLEKIIKEEGSKRSKIEG